MSNLSRLEETLAYLQPQIDEINRASLELENRRRAITKIVSDLSETFTEEENEDEDQFDELIEALGDFASNFDYTWNGAYDYEDWTIGERVEFWVPSTC